MLSEERLGQNSIWNGLSDDMMNYIMSLATEFASLLSKLSVCRQSEREAKYLLDKETYDFIFAAPLTAAAAAAAAAGRVPRRAAGTRLFATRPPSITRAALETTHLQRLLNDLHDFRDAGHCASDCVCCWYQRVRPWVVQVLSLLASVVQEYKY